MASRGEIYSTRSDSERRSYFFNVKENRRGDVFLNIVESNKKSDGESFERHQVMVYEEDLKDFMVELQKAASILLKRNEIKSGSGPKKFRKVQAAASPANSTSKHPTKGESRPSSTNLKRKKVTLNLKKKRRDEQSGENPA